VRSAIGGRPCSETRCREGSLNRGGVYRLVTTDADLGTVLATIDESLVVGLDIETVGLNPRIGRIRLLQIATDRDDVVFLIDCFAVSPEPLWDVLREKTIVGHNLAFDLAMLRGLGFEPVGPVHDLMIRSRLLTAGSLDGNALADLTERFLGKSLDKSMQTSDWSTPTLSEEQLRYAALDVAYLHELHRRIDNETVQANLVQTAAIEARALPAWIWMATAGMLIDRDAWRPLAQATKAEKDRLLTKLEELAPQRPETLLGMSRWKFNSHKQVRQALELLGFRVANTKDQTLAGIDHPFADALREYRHAKWLDGTYGEAFLRFVEADGRVYADWNQTGNEAGRSSCSEPNLQGIPRDIAYRRAFIAPPGRVLLKADFATAHLRIAARIADERKMLDAFQAKQDLHRLTAQALLGKVEVTKQDRQLAKAVAFGLLYGMGSKGLRVYAQQSYGVALTLEEAARHRATFFKTYPGLARWHRRTNAARATQMESRTLAGRRRLLDPKTPLMHRLNSPVLGTEADAAKTALALLWERRRECPSARPIAFIHDEIVLEADAADADAAKAWVEKAMLDALAPLIAPVPVEVEVTVGRTWGGD
jgi:DNA polymerase-1